MKRNNNFFVNRVLLSTAFLLCFFSYGKSQSAHAKAYPGGVFVFCHSELPKKFSYLIEKQNDKGEWVSVVELQAPESLAACNARMQTLPPEVASVTRVKAPEIEFVWSKIQDRYATLDSLYAYGVDPRYQYVAGTGWFDTDANKPGTYNYKVSKLTALGEVILIGEVKASTPAKQLDETVIPLRFKLNPSSVEISYKVENSQTIAGLKLYRSIYLDNSYEEIVPGLIYTVQEDEMVAILTDNTVTSGLTYSYVAKPHDALGNLGLPTDTVNIYFMSEKLNLGVVSDIAAVAQPENNGNLISWDYVPEAFIKTIEIYRSTEYEGDYQRIASVASNKTSYLDQDNIQPALAYFYYVQLNNGYETGLPSTRVPAVLEGTKVNMIPPQNLTLQQKGNVVTLQFDRVGHDIRGYVVYRGDGYDSPMQQLPRMILSQDSVLSYNDTLPASSRAALYSYAVASINTSYSISPFSNRENVVYSGGQLPTPSLRNVSYSNKEVSLIWDDVADYNSAITGYEIVRKITDGVNKDLSPEELIGVSGFEYNSFVDKNVQPGNNYVYRVRSIANDSTDVSSYSLPFSVYVPIEGVLNPAHVAAYAADAKILLQWTLPLSNDMDAVQVFRAAEGEEKKLLVSLGADTEAYEDSSAKKNVMYYYFITIKYKNGQETKPTDAVSAMWE